MAQPMRKLQRYLLGHFRVLLCLCFKASLSAKPFIWNKNAIALRLA